MVKLKNEIFYKIYIVFGSIFFLLCFSIIILIVQNTSSDGLLIPVVFILIAIAILNIAFVFTIRCYVSKIFDNIDCIMDKAINNNLKDLVYEETLLSLFSNKLMRFVMMSSKGLANINQQKEKIESLISDISHQTKTPIANVLIFSELLEEKIKDNEFKGYVHNIKVQAEKLKWLIQSLIKISRLESRLITYNIQKNNIKKMLIQAVNQVYSTAERKNIAIKMVCTSSDTANFDSKWTSEAIVNILENSVKYTPSGGKVGVSVTPYEMFVQIDIIDTGIGIAEDEINSIFKRFYRSQAVFNQEGVGVGLFLTREILEAEKGYITVHSELNKGTTFSVFLPQ